MVLFHNRFKLLGSVRYPIDNDLLDEPNFKYADIDFVRKFCGHYTHCLLPLLERYLEYKHKHILVDVKVHNLKKGQTPALMGWHIDCVKSPDHPSKEENHILFITGDGCLPKFMTKPIELEESETGFYSVDNPMGEFVAPSCRFIQYGRTLHTCQIAQKDEVRYLLRVTETDVVKPNNRIRKELYYGN